MTTLIILDDDAPSLTQLPDSTRGDHVILLLLTPDDARAQQLCDRLQTNGLTVTTIDAAGRLDAVAPDVREAYSRLIAGAADALYFGRKTLRHAFIFENRLSLWWINELFGKRSDAYPTFNRLCQLALIRRVAAENDVTTCHIITNDSDFQRVLAAFCTSANIALCSPAPHPDHLPPRAWLRIVGDSCIWFAKTLLQSLLVRRDQGSHPPADSDKQFVAFHTLYPLLWRGGDRSRDEKYGATPFILRDSGQFSAAYACSFSAEGHHQRVTVRGFRRLRDRWRQADSGALPLFLLDAYLLPRDVLRLFWLQLGIYRRFGRIERDPAFLAYWQLDGISIWPLIQNEWRMAARRMGHYLTYALRVRRFVEAEKPGAFVYTMFEFGLGRAIAYGALSASSPPRLIAVQEGPITGHKLMTVQQAGEFGRPSSPNFIDRMPQPDAILVEGPLPKACLVAAGYAADTIHIVGAPRLDRLAVLPRRDRQNHSAEKRTILVAFWGYGAESMLRRTLPLLQPCYRLLFKVHPRGDMSAAAIGDWLKRHAPERDYDVVTGDIYALYAQSDVVVATSSSVALEAAALGIPVVVLRLPDAVTASPLLDVASANVRFAADSAELAAAVAQIAITDDVAASDAVEKALFDRLDGQSAARWATLIAQLAGDNA